MNKSFFPFILIFLSLASLAEDKKSETVYGEIREQKDETLNKLLNVKGVEAQYDACKKEIGTNLDKLPKCIWEGEGKVGPLSENIKKDVQKMYAQGSPASDEKSHLTNKEKNLDINYMSDPAVVALSKVMQKKLETAMLGDEEAQKDKKTIVAVDHAKYSEIYKTELGKTIVNAFTSYCIETSPSCGASALDTCFADEDVKIRTSDRNKNIENLKSANFDSSNKKWNNCITDVPKVCYDKNLTGNNDYSKQKACLIMDYIKSARKNMMIVDEQKEFYSTLSSKVTLTNLNTRFVEVNDKNSIDAITTVTSGDLESSKKDAESYQSKNDELKLEMDKCLNKETNQVTDEEACKKFLSTNKEDKEKAFAEFGLKQYALESEINEKVTDKKEVEKYLKEEGYKKEKIDEMLNSEDTITLVKNEIKDRYARERESIISSMAEKMTSKTASVDGKIDSSDKSADVEKLKKIREELSSRPDDLKQLVHFNNIVSSYLEIDKGKGEKGRNIASLYAEVGNGAKSLGDEQFKEIEESAKKAGLNKESKGQSTNLNIEDLNNILKYSSEK